MLYTINDLPCTYAELMNVSGLTETLGTFDWAVPQQWMDDQLKKDPSFNVGHWVWVYAPGSIFGEPFNFYAAAMQKLKKRLVHFLSNNPTSHDINRLTRFMDMPTIKAAYSEWLDNEHAKVNPATTPAT
jgi:hypothetical protein